MPGNPELPMSASFNHVTTFSMFLIVFFNLFLDAGGDLAEVCRMRCRQEVFITQHRKREGYQEDVSFAAVAIGDCITTLINLLVSKITTFLGIERLTDFLENLIVHIVSGHDDKIISSQVTKPGCWS